MDVCVCELRGGYLWQTTVGLCFPVSLFLMEGEKNSGTLSFDLTLEQLHTVKGREMERKMG